MLTASSSDRATLELLSRSYNDAFDHSRNISKHYRLGVERGGRYRTLRESIGDAANASVRHLRSVLKRTTSNKARPADHWALKDVSFQIRPGEAVGIIGRNRSRKIHAAQDPQPDHVTN